MDFLQLLLEANATLEAQPSPRFTRVIDAVDALEHRPSQTSINFRILREVSCDNKRCVNYQLLAIVGGKGSPSRNDERIEAHFGRLVERHYVALGGVLDC